MTLPERITQYLEAGGLFNPEMMGVAYEELQKEFAALESQAGAMREALRPFAIIANSYDHTWPGGTTLKYLNDATVTLGDCRKADAALKEKT